MNKSLIVHVNPVINGVRSLQFVSVDISGVRTWQDAKSRIAKATREAGGTEFYVADYETDIQEAQRLSTIEIEDLIPLYNAYLNGAEGIFALWRLRKGPAFPIIELYQKYYVGRFDSVSGFGINALSRLVGKERAIYISPFMDMARFGEEALKKGGYLYLHGFVFHNF